MKEKNTLSKITAAILVVSMVLGSVASIATQAITSNTPSLDYIETIKETKASEGSAFKILEVTPDATKGQMGYIVDGYEATNGWENNLKAITGKTSRKTYADTILNNLDYLGIRGTGNKAPLESTGNYTEYYPWENAPSGASTLELDEADTVLSVNGQFEKAEGGGYSVEATYSLPNLFSAEDWYIDFDENHNKYASSRNATYEYSDGKIIVNNPATGSSDDNYSQHSWGGGDTSWYKIPCKPRTTYTFTYTVDVESSNHGRSQIFFFGYGKNYNETMTYNGNGQPQSWYVAKSDYQYDSGTYTWNFTTGRNVYYLGFRCGTASARPTKATFSDITLYETADQFAGGEYVQDATYFVYGDAAEGGNIFSMEDFADNIYTYHPLEMNGKMNYQYGVLSFDAVKTNVLWSKIEAATYYQIPVESNTKYTFKYTIENEAKTEGYTQAVVWAIGLSNLGNQQLYSKYDDTNGTYEAEFTTGNNIDTIVFSFGANNENTIAKFSGISLTKSEVTPDTSGTYYYYNPVFTLVTAGANLDDGTIVYERITAANANEGEVVGKYRVVGEYYSDGSGVILDVFSAYYTASITNCTPSIKYDRNHEYRTVRDTTYHYKNTGEKGFFVQSAGIGTYEGDGFGEYKLNTSKSGSVTVKTATVYYTGGYTSNDWFRYRVLDADDSELGKLPKDRKYNFPITVTTIEPQNLESEIDTLTTYDLVVFSTGLNYNTRATIDWGRDIPTSFMTVYGTAGSRPYKDLKLPTVYFKSLESVSGITNMRALINQLKTNANKTTTSTGWVTDYIYCYNPNDINATTYSYKEFSTNVKTELYNTSSAPYFEVANEIGNENFLRQNHDVNLLPYEISVATSIRYILNFKGQRIIFNKDTINILDIEPYTSGKEFDKTTKRLKDIAITGDSDKVLTEEQVVTWFPADRISGGKLVYKYLENGKEKQGNVKINIVTMAANELVADVDDIVETYDIVYIGDSTYNMNTKLQEKGNRAYGYGEVPDYNDDNMDGIYYTNIGDIMYTNARNIWAENNLGGLISDDYTWMDASSIGLKAYALLEGWNEFKERSSGNDLTAVKEKQLENFINAGLPVIVADNLTTGFAGTLTAKADGKMTFTYRKELSKTYLWGAIKIYKKVPYYHIDAEGWLEGFPVEVDYEKCVTYEWYLKKRSTGEIVRLVNTAEGAENVNVKIETINHVLDNGDVILSTHIDYKINAENISQYEGTIYAKATVNNTYYPELNNLTLTTNTMETKVVTRTIYLRGERIEAAEITDAAGYTEIKEVRPSDLTDSSKFSEYLDPSLNGSARWFYVVRAYGDSSRNINNRVWIYTASNEWHYRGAAGVTYLFDEPYRYADYLREGSGKGELKPDGIPSKRGYDKMYYTKPDGSTGDVRVGTPAWDSSYSSNREIQSRFLEMTVNSNSGTFGKQSQDVYGAPNVSRIGVDNSSYMYQFLDYAFNGDAETGATSRYGRNFFAEREFGSDRKGDETRQLISEYLSMSSPRIIVNEGTVTAYPSITTDKTINVEFTIQNASDVGAANARYHVNFYVDLDSDGKFKPDELTDFTLNQKVNGGSWAQTTEDNLHTTTKNTTYTYQLYRALPTEFSGLLPWKIEIIKLDENGKYTTKDKNGNYTTEINYSNLHDSYMNYAYVVRDEATIIQAIQLLPSDWTMEYKRNSKVTSDDGNVYTGSIFMSDVYKNLLGSNWKYVAADTLQDGMDTIYMCYGPVDASGRMQDYSGYINHYLREGGDMATYGGKAPDFFVILNCINVKDLNGYYGTQSGNYETRIRSEDFFDKYNMLIMGFADSWGKAGRVNNASGSTGTVSEATNIGLNMGAAFAIQDFIESGRSVLFAHDTTTVYNNFANNVILKTGIDVANVVAQWTAKVTEAIDKGIKWLVGLFGGDSGKDTFMTVATDWLNGLDLESDERARNGYWVNLLRDVVGLDRYGATYAIKEKAKCDYVACTKCGKTYALSDIGKECTVKDEEGDNCSGLIKNIGEIQDKYLYWGYYTDTYIKQDDNIYNSGLSHGNTGETHYTYDTTIAAMLANDYTIAYEPDTSRTKTNKYVSGFTRHALTRFAEETDDRRLPTAKMYQSGNEIYPTEYITQTNKGQITMYPYDINLYKTDDKGNRIVDENGGYEYDDYATMKVGKTHEQYYTVNPNGDDITVWFCMNGENFGDIPNDSMNNYYIFSRKNVTYTGAGHTNEFTTMEAQLFANTLIAAFRPTTDLATVNFTMEQSTQENKDYTSTRYILLTSSVDSETAADGSTTSSETVSGDNVFISVTNRNLGYKQNNRNYVKLYLYFITDYDEKGNPIYDESNRITDVGKLYYIDIENKESEVKWDHVRDNGIYRFEVPQAVLDKLAEDGATSVDIGIKVVTIRDGSKATDENGNNSTHSEATVRKLGLRDLS